MTSKEGGADELASAQKCIRDATREADLRASADALTKIKRLEDPRFDTASILEKVNELVVFDGRPLLQEDLESALQLLDTANSIETTQKILDLREKVKYEIDRINNEPNIHITPPPESK